MARQGEVFVIDGDDLIKAPGKGAAAPARAGSATQTIQDVRPAVAGGTGAAHPAGAASMSLWVWGAGQWLNGDRDLAMLLFLWELQIAALHYFVASTWGTICRMAHIFFISEWELLLYAAALDFWLIFLLIFTVSQAYRSAEKQRGRYHGAKSPWLAGLTSLIVPGWGQIINGQLGKGLTFLFVFVLQGYLLCFYMMTPLYRIVSDLDPGQSLLRDLIQIGKIALLFTAQVWLLSVYDAVLVARYTRNRAR